MARKVRRPADPQVKRRAVLRGLAIGCGAALLLALLVGLSLYVKATGQATLPDEIQQRLRAGEGAGGSAAGG